MVKSYYVYIITNKYNTVFYIGVTDNLQRRMFEHVNSLVQGFSKKYNFIKLVYYEEHDDINKAIAREKQLKNWHRDWKINMIKRINEDMKDLQTKWL